MPPCTLSTTRALPSETTSKCPASLHNYRQLFASCRSITRPIFGLRGGGGDRRWLSYNGSPPKHCLLVNQKTTTCTPHLRCFKLLRVGPPSNPNIHSSICFGNICLNLVQWWETAIVRDSSGFDSLLVPMAPRKGFNETWWRFIKSRMVEESWSLERCDLRFDGTRK